MVREAVAEGKLSKIRGGRIVLPPKEDFITGKLFVSRAGHGFVLSDGDEGDIYISSRDLGGAIHGEQVKFILKPARGGRAREGKIMGVIGRENGRVVGRLRIKRLSSTTITFTIVSLLK